MSSGTPRDEKGVSNLIATLILIAVAVVGGGFMYSAFRQQTQSATTSADLQVQSLDAVSVDGSTYLSVTVKNVGTERLTGIKVTVNPGGDQKKVPLEGIPNLNPGQTGFDSETWGDDPGENPLDAGTSYPVLIEAGTPDGGSLTKTTTVRVRS